MKDNEFERLLNDSIKQYGSEYYHGADGPIDTGPAPMHVFRDDFLSDIVISPKKPKKPLIIRLLPFIGSAAAVAVIGIFVATIAPKLTSENITAPGSLPTASSTSKFIGALDRSPDNNNTDKTDRESSAVNAVSASVSPSRSDEFSNGGKSAYEQTSEYYETPAEETPSSSTPSYSPVSPQNNRIPDSTVCTVFYNKRTLKNNGSFNTLLAEQLGNIMTDDYEWYSSVPVGSAPAYAEIYLTASTEAMTINGSSYRMITVMVSRDEILITAYRDNGTDYYDCDFSDRNYAGLTGLIDTLSNSQ